MYTQEQLDLMKKQWEMMGLDADMMLQQLNNSMKLMAEMQNNYAPLNNNAAPFIENINTEEEDEFFNFENEPSIKEESDIQDEALLKDLAFGANLAFLNCEYLNTLETFKPYEQILASLEMDWGITNKAELTDMLDWLYSEGQRKLYNTIWAKLKGVPVAEWATKVEEAKLQLLTENGDYENIQESAMNIAIGYKILKKIGCFKTMKEPSILTWDLGRAINLVRWGYDVKFLTKTEASDLIRKFSSELKKEYDSWSSLSEGYLMGFMMWSGDEEELADLYEDQQVLLTHAKSPWVSYNW